jgi:hypothetical protein
MCALDRHDSRPLFTHDDGRGPDRIKEIHGVSPLGHRQCALLPERANVKGCLTSWQPTSRRLCIPSPRPSLATRFDLDRADRGATLHSVAGRPGEECGRRKLWSPVPEWFATRRAISGTVLQRYGNRSSVATTSFRTPQKERARRWSEPVGCFVMSCARRSRAAMKRNTASGECGDGNSAAFSTTLQSTIVTGSTA